MLFLGISLDYGVWKKIMDDLLESSPRGKETKEQFLKRLEKVAKSLPRGFVAKQINRMKGNVQAVYDAKGWLPKND